HCLLNQFDKLHDTEVFFLTNTLYSVFEHVQALGAVDHQDIEAVDFCCLFCSQFSRLLHFRRLRQPNATATSAAAEGVVPAAREFDQIEAEFVDHFARRLTPIIDASKMTRIV